MLAIKFTGTNISEIEEFLGSKIDVATGPLDADPELRIAGKQFFRYDLPGWGDPEWYARIVEGDWLERTPTDSIIRWYPEQFASVYPSYDTPVPTPPDQDDMAAQLRRLTEVVDQLILDQLMGGN